MSSPSGWSPSPSSSPPTSSTAGASSEPPGTLRRRGLSLSAGAVVARRHGGLTAPPPLPRRLPLVAIRYPPFHRHVATSRRAVVRGRVEIAIVAVAASVRGRHRVPPLQVLLRPAQPPPVLAAPVTVRGVGPPVAWDEFLGRLRVVWVRHLVRVELSLVATVPVRVPDAALVARRDVELDVGGVGLGQGRDGVLFGLGTATDPSHHPFQVRLADMVRVGLLDTARRLLERLRRPLAVEHAEERVGVDDAVCVLAQHVRCQIRQDADVLADHAQTSGGEQPDDAEGVPGEEEDEAEEQDARVHDAVQRRPHLPKLFEGCAEDMYAQYSSKKKKAYDRKNWTQRIWSSNVTDAPMPNTVRISAAAITMCLQDIPHSLRSYSPTTWKSMIGHVMSHEQ
eukprot:CAMPEP_0202853052 /NCGR_PEP_ID=MMETSP1389-20130828/90282_1 /ASSEMBLY_ACC=CAM_ASM_000865 /TAXON_ID=302021 /ORGANISM="Rhodomonas sp., Strain CCMP768" /LENGTH=394 /DNA_ID=CAMNT_0049531591 /DNA_START=682 /DNA_END=1867 /DNA_ORIENTATION=-